MCIYIYSRLSEYVHIIICLHRIKVKKSNKLKWKKIFINIINTWRTKSYENWFWKFFTGDVNPCKILSMGIFFTPLHHTNVFEKKVGKGYLPEIHFYGRSGVFTTSIHLNFYQVMSLHVYIFHFTTPPSRWMIKVASTRGSQGCRTIVRYML